MLDFTFSLGGFTFIGVSCRFHFLMIPYWKNMICFHFKVELLLEDIGDDWENLSSSEEEIKKKPR